MPGREAISGWVQEPTEGPGQEARTVFVSAVGEGLRWGHEGAHRRLQTAHRWVRVLVPWCPRLHPKVPCTLIYMHEASTQPKLTKMRMPGVPVSWKDAVWFTCRG